MTQGLTPASRSSLKTFSSFANAGTSGLSAVRQLYYDQYLP